MSLGAISAYDRLKSHVGVHGRRGLCTALTVDDLAFRIRMDAATVEEMLLAALDAGVVVWEGDFWFLSEWTRLQPPASRDRMRESRANRKKRDVNGDASQPSLLDVTSRSEPVTSPFEPRCDLNGDTVTSHTQKRDVTVTSRAMTGAERTRLWRRLNKEKQVLIASKSVSHGDVTYGTLPAKPGGVTCDVDVTTCDVPGSNEERHAVTCDVHVRNVLDQRSIKETYVDVTPDLLRYVAAARVAISSVPKFEGEKIPDPELEQWGKQVLAVTEIKEALKDLTKFTRRNSCSPLSNVLGPPGPALKAWYRTQLPRWARVRESEHAQPALGAMPEVQLGPAVQLGSTRRMVSRIDDAAGTTEYRARSPEEVAAFRATLPPSMRKAIGEKGSAGMAEEILRAANDG